MAEFLLNRRRRGFTLIELMVVMSIFTLMAAIIIVSLNNSRKKASDAGIKQSMDSMLIHIQALSTPVPLANFSTMCMDPAIQSVLASIGGTCNGSPGGWAIYAPLKDPPAGSTGWCLDSSGAAKASKMISSIICGGSSQPN